MKKVILITGASTGIGASAALTLSKKGHTVLAGIRKIEDGERLKTLDSSIHPLLLDVTIEDHVQDAKNWIENQYGRLDALVNNAGIATGGPVETTELKEWKRVFEVNVFGAVRVTKAFLPLLRKSKGRVVNISSISGFVASPYMSVYAASKFALEAFSDSLRRELLSREVHVSIIEPGPIQTPIWEKSITPATNELQSMSEELKKVYGKSAASFAENIESAVQTAAPVEWVSKDICHAILSKNPKTRYLVGKSKFFIKALSKLPDKLSDQLILNLRR